MRKILIQANDLGKVIEIFKYVCLHPHCSNKDIAEYIGFSLRQVAYYTGACKYLGLFDDGPTPTELGLQLFASYRDGEDIENYIYDIIIQDEYIGKIYRKITEDPDSDIAAFAMDLTIDRFPGYSEGVYIRRSDNMVKWCRKIKNIINR